MAREDWENWRAEASCTLVDPETFFGRGQYLHAKSVCGVCVVADECLAEALDGEIEFGTWGGKSGPERLAMLRDEFGPGYQWPPPPGSYWEDFRMERERAA